MSEIYSPGNDPVSIYLRRMKMEIRLGDFVRDPITGYKGTVISRTKYLNGCARVGVQGKLKPDGSVPELEYFDEMQLQEIEDNQLSGGPRPDPPKRTI